MSCVLYLDYDGVLHNDSVYRVRGHGIVIRDGVLFEWAHYLVEALMPYPDIRIVLSTSWVRELGYDRARSYLPPALHARAIGATFHRREHAPTPELRWHWAQAPRGVQIQEDIARRRPARWFAIDDAVDEFTGLQLSWLVPCTPSAGLSDSVSREMLREMLLFVSR